MLDFMIDDLDSYHATTEILADRELTERLLAIAKTIDNDVENNKLYSMREVLG
jgi:hypothetical protein